MTPAEAIVRQVHVNLKTLRQGRVSFATGTVSAGCEIIPGTRGANMQAFRPTTH
jgi:hypothetical protein